MKTRFLIAFGLTLSFLIYQDLSLGKSLADNQYAQTTVCMSPNNNCDLLLTRTIQDAQEYVDFAIYTFTKENIADALIAAKLRGLKVRGVMDFNQSTISQEKPIIKKLQKYGIEIKIPEKESGLMHIKLLVTDNGYAFGSFNWTASATNYNDEILETGKVEALRKKYLEIWNKLYKKY